MALLEDPLLTNLDADEVRSPTMDDYYGVDIEILRVLAQSLNFRPRLVEPTDRLAYGYKKERRKKSGRSTVDDDDDTSFTGALGDLLSNRTDMILNGFFIKNYGSRRLRFTVGLYSDRLCFVVRAAEMVMQICIRSQNASCLHVFISRGSYQTCGCS